MVSKWRTHKRFSLSVRMKRSATPLPSGWRTKDGEASMPRKAISLWKSSDIEFGPWSCRSMRPAATSLPTAPKYRRTPWRTGSRAWKRLALLSAWMPTHSLLPHDGTITTEAVDVLWGTDMTQSVTLAEGVAHVFVAVDHCAWPVVADIDPQ